MSRAPADDDERGLRARVLGGALLEAGGRPVRPPSGAVEALLARFLLRPNEVHAADDLVRALWGEGDLHDVRLRQRLYVAINRLRAFLADAHGDDDGASPAGVRLVTAGGGYRLDADADSHDRLAFDALAERALAGDHEAGRRALALLSDDPYGALPPSPEREAERAAVRQMRDRVAEVVDADGPSLADQMARARYLRPPGDARAVVARPRLMALADAAGAVPVVVAVAPAGFGKSTFLAQWADARPGPVAWLELDERDDDAHHLWADVCSALVEAGVVDPSTRPQDAAPGSARFREALAAGLTAAPAPAALILDDAHEVGADTWRAELPRILALAPGRLTVAVGTRQPLEVPGLTDGEDVVQLTADDLRLDPGETLDVVRLSDPTAEPGDVAALAQVASGWPIVVSYLSRAGARPDGEALNLRPLHEYVVDEVLDHAPAGVRDLLLATAALDRLDARLCDAVTGGRDAAEHLAWLRDQALVLDVRRDGGWARRHPLVTQALRQRAERDATIDLPTQHRRAARWFLAQGMAEEALRHAVAGDDRQTIAATAGDVVWAAMSRGEIATCRRWLQVIDPEAVIANRADHDVCMLAVQHWAEPHLTEAWLEARRRHYGPEGDVMALQAETHRHYLHGRLRLSREADVEAARLTDGYFARHPNRPGFRDLVEDTIAAGPIIDAVLAGEVHHDDPRMTALVDVATREMPVMALWILGEWAFLAWVEGDGEMAARLVDEAAPRLRALDEASAQFGACRLLAATALVESDRTAERQQQRRIGQRLRPMVPLFGGLRWDVELIPVLLALHLTSLRGGQLDEAGRWLAEADVLLELCDEVPLLHRARARVAQAPWVGGAGDREDTLTPKERAVLRHLSAGATYAETADALGTSHHTVRSHAAAVYRKLGLRNRKGLRSPHSEI